MQLLQCLQALPNLLAPFLPLHCTTSHCRADSHTSRPGLAVLLTSLWNSRVCNNWFSQARWAGSITPLMISLEKPIRCYVLLMHWTLKLSRIPEISGRFPACYRNCPSHFVQLFAVLHLNHFKILHGRKAVEYQIVSTPECFSERHKYSITISFPFQFSSITMHVLYLRTKDFRPKYVYYTVYCCLISILFSFAKY